MEEKPTITIALSEYNEMRDDIVRLEKENKELREVVENVKDMDETRVILKEYLIDLEDGKCKALKYSFKNFADVEGEVRTAMTDTLDEARKKLDFAVEQLEKLKADSEERMKTLDKLKQQTLEAQRKCSELMNRNWWQRLFNLTK